MKVVQVSTHDTGGAALAAYRLHKGLQASNVSSSFLVLYNTGKFEDAITFKPKRYKFWHKKVIKKLYRHKLLFNNEVELFSTPDTLYDILSSPIVREADIVHLHWVANFLDYKSFFRFNKKKVVWTFHDLNPIQGGLHYRLDYTRASSELLIQEKKYFDFKIRCLEQAKHLSIISPSNWMKSEIEKSVFNKLFDVVTVINYGLDLSVFDLRDRMECRKTLNLDLDKIIILMVATDLRNYRKGFDMALKVMNRMADNDDVRFLLVGEMNDIRLPVNARSVGTLTEDKLVLLYNAVNGLLLPSREDNLPNVMLESLACGTPVFGFGVGGIKEVVNPEINGILTETVTSDSLFQVTNDFISQREEFSRHEIRADTSTKFDLIAQAKKVTNVYSAIIKKNW